MTTIVTRASKGTPLTWTEADANFTNLQTQVDSTLPAATAAVQTNLDNHLADTVDAHDASAISIADAGGYTSATEVESALQSLFSANLDHLADTTDAHDASAISVLDTDDYLSATDVEASIKEMIERFLTPNRNKVINGAMAVDQRVSSAGTGVQVAVNAWTWGPDRWGGYGQPADGVFTIQQLTTTPPTGFTYYTRIKTTTADASIGAAQLYAFGTKIEGYNWANLGYGAAGAKTVTLSFWVRSSLTGTFGGSLSNNTTRSYPFSYTINAANTWEKKTLTIVGDTTGTWNTDNTLGAILIFGIGFGSNNLGTAGAWSSSFTYGTTGQTNMISTLNATWDITGVQIEMGSKATPFEYRDFGMELRMCERYYEKSYNMAHAVGSANTNGSILIYDGVNGGYFPILYRTRKRAQVSPTIYSPATGASGKYRDNSSGADFTATTTGDGEMGSNIQYAAHGAADEAVSFHYVVDAEL